MERKKIILPIALVVSIAILDEVNVASAAYVSDNNATVNQVMDGLSGGGAGFGEIFRTQLTNLSNNPQEQIHYKKIVMKNLQQKTPLIYERCLGFR